MFRNFKAVDEAIRSDAEALSNELYNLRARLFPPSAAKTLRQFSSGEAAALIGVSDAYLRQLSLAGEGPAPAFLAGGRRAYTLLQVNEYRRFLSRDNGRDYLPARRDRITSKSSPSPISREARAKPRRPHT